MIELSAVAKAALGQLLSAVTTHVRDWFKKTPIADPASVSTSANTACASGFPLQRIAPTEVWVSVIEGTTAPYLIRNDSTGRRFS